MIAKLILGACIALAPQAAPTGNEPVRGTESGFWKHHSVVYAQVTDVSSVRPGLAKMTLAVMATLAGWMDAAENPRLEVDLLHGVQISAVAELPKPKTRVVALVMRWGDDSYTIRSSPVVFMPNQAAILQVKSFDAPEVQEIIGHLRELRSRKATPEAKESKGE